MAPPSASGSKKSPTLKLLITKLRALQTRFNEIWRFVEQYKDDITTTQLSIRLEKLDELWDKYGDALIEVQAHDEFDSEDDIYEKESYELSERYYEAKAFLMDRIKERQGPDVAELSVRDGVANTQGSVDHVRLPQIRLQTFNGDIEEWLGFRDLFVSLINNKAELPDVEKFHYLKGCLEGEPKNIIDGLQISGANYQIAWNMLLKRYDNCKQLKKRQAQLLFKLPSLQKESPKELHALLEGFEKTVQTLDQIIQPAEYKDLLLINLLTIRLDPVTRRAWEELASTKEQEYVTDLTEFLQRRVQVLESLAPKITESKLHQQLIASKSRTPVLKTCYSNSQGQPGRCVLCNSNHLLHQCSMFLRMVASEREAVLRTNTLCRNCFKHGHMARDCPSRFSCRKCKARHHTLVCFKNEREGNRSTVMKGGSNSQSSGSIESTSNTTAANIAATEVCASSAAVHSTNILLATAIIIIEDDDGNRIPARALLDSGSESNFVSERICRLLRVAKHKADIMVTGIGQGTTRVTRCIHATIRSRVAEYTREMSFLVLSKLTVRLPTTTISTANWKIPKGVELADPAFGVSGEIDVVLGIEAFFDFFETGRKLSLGAQLPMLNESVFGWIVSGGLVNVKQTSHITCNVTGTERLEDLMTQFWSCEEVESTNYSLEESECETLYTNTVERSDIGRYTVSLPKSAVGIQRLGRSRDIAMRRLLSTERRLSRDPELRLQYTAFMEEYCMLGHMRKVDTATDLDNRCYLPHHPIIKEASTTTKVRVVFDASCKTSSGVSLNDILLLGPVIQQDLRAIILRCRTKQIMLIADVEKMFRQINICQADRALQCILWRSSPNEEVSTFELNTVTYGTKPAPFLATRTLKQLSIDEKLRFPLAARALCEDTYMDDVITGTDTEEEALNLRNQLDDMLAAGGFQLRKWASNNSGVLCGLEKEKLAICINQEINLDPDPSVKALGLIWIPSSDLFRFQV